MTDPAPKYIPASAEGGDGNDNLLTPEEANVSGDGTSKNTLRTDFNALAGYLSAVIGGPSSNVVTTNGKNTFGKQYFYNTGAKCKIDSDENLNYCDHNAKVGDEVYEYIYVSTLSNGLMPGIMNDVIDMAKVPFKIAKVMATTGGSKCRCVPLNVTTEGVTKCTAAFMNTRNVFDDNVVKNRCTNPVIDKFFPGGGGIMNASDTINGALKNLPAIPSVSSVTNLIPGFKSGFRNMKSPIHGNIDKIFILGIGLLFIVVLYKLINNFDLKLN